jgi:hypothetical protein
MMIRLCDEAGMYVLIINCNCVSVMGVSYPDVQMVPSTVVTFPANTGATARNPAMQNATKQNADAARRDFFARMAGSGCEMPRCAIGPTEPPHQATAYIVQSLATESMDLRFLNLN